MKPGNIRGTRSSPSEINVVYLGIVSSAKDFELSWPIGTLALASGLVLAKAFSVDAISSPLLKPLPHRLRYGSGNTHLCKLLATLR